MREAVDAVHFPVQLLLAGYEGPLALDADDHALLYQRGEGLPDGGPADVEPPAELLLGGQQVARLKGAVEDAPLDHGHDLVVKGHIEVVLEIVVQNGEIGFRLHQSIPRLRLSCYYTKLSCRGIAPGASAARSSR
ncbi:hypothetical protein SDC9_163434 [bioreactor metagenome]|uniref:Uncharacterized protein n=1 Tax=bioreactor metagenome TaxID=1076179 RepID=A0A645FQV9_9ZZZZ